MVGHRRQDRGRRPDRQGQIRSVVFSGAPQIRRRRENEGTKKRIHRFGPSRREIRHKFGIGLHKITSMQKILVTALLGSALSLTALSVSAQHNYVKDRPHETVVTR